MQILGYPPLQRLFTSSKNEEGSETMKIAGKPGNLENKLVSRWIHLNLKSIINTFLAERDEKSVSFFKKNFYFIFSRSDPFITVTAGPAN